MHGIAAGAPALRALDHKHVELAGKSPNVVPIAPAWFTMATKARASFDPGAYTGSLDFLVVWVPL